MQRRPRALADRRFDVVVVGGGIYGVSLAREAVLRGLSVALVEKGDFGAATSANSHKMVHGGLRYLQHADFRRVLESIRERSAFLRIAPHLVRPQPFVMPIYGHGLRGREAMFLALKLNDLLSLGRNRGVDPGRHIPAARIVSRDECLRLAPGIDERGLTGAAVWHDGLMLNSERLLFAILRSAVEAGAEAVNYAEATDVVVAAGRAHGVRVRDLSDGAELAVRASVVVHAGGPWSVDGLPSVGGARTKPAIGLAKAVNLVTRPITGDHAIGVRRRFRDPSGALRTDARLFFLVPWRDRTLIGTAYLPHGGAPDDSVVSEAEIERLLEEINLAYPPAGLTRGDVRFVHCGLVPIAAAGDPASELEVARRYQIRDHAEEGLEGVVSVMGVKYTTARGVAETAIDCVIAKLGRPPVGSRSAELPLHGGDLGAIDAYVAREAESPPRGVAADTVRHLIAGHGPRYRDVIEEARGDRGLLAPIGERTNVIGAEVLHAVRDEMAVRLADVVFRRTELGSAGDPGEAALSAAAALVARELGWDEARVASELAEVRRRFP